MNSFETTQMLLPVTGRHISSREVRTSDQDGKSLLNKHWIGPHKEIV